MTEQRALPPPALLRMLRLAYELLAPGLVAAVAVLAADSEGEWFTAGVISASMIFLSLHSGHMRELKRRSQEDTEKLAKRLRKRAAYAERAMSGRAVTECALLGKEAEAYSAAAALVEELI